MNQNTFSIKNYSNLPMIFDWSIKKLKPKLNYSYKNVCLIKRCSLHTTKDYYSNIFGLKKFRVKRLWIDVLKWI